MRNVAQATANGYYSVTLTTATCPDTLTANSGKTPDCHESDNTHRNETVGTPDTVKQFEAVMRPLLP